MNNHQLIEDLKQIAIPRHSKWDELGLMSTRVYVKKRLAEYGKVEEHFFKEGSDDGVNYILNYLVRKQSFLQCL